MKKQPASLISLRTLLAAALTLPLASLTFAADPAKPTVVACVGDSITFGAGVEKREENHYPKVLGELLGKSFETKNFGRSGATLLKQGDLPYWKTKEFENASASNPDIVVIKLGTNDSKPQNWKHKDQFISDAKALVLHFRNLPSKPVVHVCLPVPVYETRWGINEPVVQSEVIPALKQVAQELHTPVIDLHTALADKPALFPDKIHPNAAGAKLIAEAVAAALRKP
jgi:lysophospholipase L1-like esterase